MASSLKHLNKIVKTTAFALHVNSLIDTLVTTLSSKDIKEFDSAAITVIKEPDGIQVSAVIASGSSKFIAKGEKYVTE